MGVLGGDSGCKGSYQLELFEVEMVTICESTMPVGKLNLLLCLVLGKGASAASEFGEVLSTKRVYTLSDQGGLYTRCVPR